MKQWTRTVATSLCLSALLPLSAFAGNKHNPKLSDDAASAPSGNVDVIIQYKKDPGAVEEAKLAGHNGKLRVRLHSIHAHAATLSQSELEALAADPNVSYISVDRPLRSHAAASTAPVCISHPEYTTEPINAPQVWQAGFIGTGIGVAVIDSGITAVDDLSVTTIIPGPKHYRIVYQASFVPAAAPAKPGAPPAPPVGPGAGGDACPVPLAPSQNAQSNVDPNFPLLTNTAAYLTFVGPNNISDMYGHGTHVAGLIAGNGTDSSAPNDFRTFYGTAPNANLIDLQALDSTGSGTDSSVIAAIEAAISLKNTYNIRVINLSLGRPIWESYTQDPLDQAVEQAWKAGIVVVAAAGNAGRDLNANPEGYGTVEAPGNDPYVITVGAINTMGTPGLGDDIMASYSSKGPTFIDHIAKPDLVAPGNLVISLQTPTDALGQQQPDLRHLQQLLSERRSRPTEEGLHRLLPPQRHKHVRRGRQRGRRRPSSRPSPPSPPTRSRPSS